MNFTEEDRAQRRKLRQEEYNNMSLDDKIDFAEFTYIFANGFKLQQKFLYRVIGLMIEKINTRHCEK